MIWEKLLTMQCPYEKCGKGLAQRDGEIQCTECYFHMDHSKYKGIVHHRLMPTTEHTRLKWQNVIDHKCPICGDNIQSNEKSMGRFVCVGRGCHFSISEKKLVGIINDTDHVAYKFHNGFLQKK